MPCRRSTTTSQEYQQDYSRCIRCIAMQPSSRSAPHAAPPEQDYHEPPRSTPTSRSRIRRATTMRCMASSNPASRTIQRDPAYPDDPYAYQDGYEDERKSPRRRSARGGLMTVAAVLALAVVGTGAAFAYRTYVGSPRTGEPPIIKADNSPTKIVPAPSDAVPPRRPTACRRAMAPRSWCRAKKRRSTSIRGPAARAWCFRR